MKKYNVQNYVRYKNDLEQALKSNDKWEKENPDRVMSIDRYIVSWLPLVENLARKFSTLYFFIIVLY